MKLTKLSAAPTLAPQAALGRRCRLMPAPPRPHAGTASQLIPGVRRTHIAPSGSWLAERRRGSPLNSIRGLSIVAVLVGLVVVGSSARSAPSDRQAVRAVVPSELKWSAVPGYAAGYARTMLEGDADKPFPFTYRVRLPAGFKFQPHTHVAEEHVTVLQGAWSLGVGETFEASRLKSFPVGSFVVVPAGTPHFVAVESETIVQVHGVGPIASRPVGDAAGHTRR